jgi:FtsZ-interacting cell division protein ZipA
MNTLSPQSEILILVGAVALVAIAIMAWLVVRSSRRRHVELRQRFGPEYERAVSEYGDEKRAERELEKREKRVQRLELHPLREAERLRFEGEWRMIQARFVDDPSGAVKAADELIQAVMQAHGYPVRDFEQRVEDLSVEHANVVQHYRAARILSDANREGRANTEELRQAFVHHRALFADLLDEPGTARGELYGAGARA